MFNNEIKRILLGSTMMSTIFSILVVGLTIYHHRKVTELLYRQTK